MFQVERELVLLFGRVWHSPVFEGDSDVVEEPLAGLRDGLEWTADDANVVEKEGRMILIRDIGRLRPCPTTPIVKRVESM